MGGANESDDHCVHSADGFCKLCECSRGRVPEEFTAWRVLSYGKADRTGSLPLMKRLAILLTAALCGFPAISGDASITGRASVIDGDTIEIRGERVRLNGIDAPESWQRCNDESGEPYRCGKVAADALDSWLAKSRPTRCLFVDRDRYGRFVGTCFRSDGADVNAWMVRSGHALDWPKYSGGRYASDQVTAKEARAGMWIGTFMSPCEARARRMKREPNC